jgi:hypothetical protein
VGQGFGGNGDDPCAWGKQLGQWPASQRGIYRLDAKVSMRFNMNSAGDIQEAKTSPDSATRGGSVKDKDDRVRTDAPICPWQ